jgi:hypothetical protein
MPDEQPVMNQVNGRLGVVKVEVMMALVESRMV